MDFQQARFNMVEQQIRPWDVLDFDLLDALETIPREEFVMPEQRGYAYADLPLPLPNGHYMLEPKIVARLVQGLALKKHETVLEVGTGAGYATAVLASLAAHVYTIDTDAQQQQFAHTILKRLNFLNIDYTVGDGLQSQGEAQYDAIYIGGGLPIVPETLFPNLKPNGGRMVVIVGSAPVQRAMLITRHDDTFQERVLFDTLVVGLNQKAISTGSKFVF